MINSLVCVPSPFLDIHPESPPLTPPEGGGNMQIDLANTLVHKVYLCLSCIVHH